MKIVFFAVFLLLVNLLLFGVSALIEKLAYERRNRYHHIRIIIALVIVFLAATNVYTVSFLIKLIDSVINNPALAPIFNAILPNRAYALVYMLLMLVGLNLLVAVGTLVTVLVVKLIFMGQRKYVNYEELTGAARALHLPWLLVNLFYEDNGGEIRLRPRGFSGGKWVKGMKWAFAFLWLAQTVVLAVSILWGKDVWNNLLLSASKAWYLLPGVSFFVLQQLQLFLEGTFYDEAGGFSSASISTQIVAEMKKLLECYRHHFKDTGALLLSDYHVEKQLSSGLEGNRLGNRQIQDCRHREVLQVVVNHIKQSNLHMNDTYKNALVELLNGNSVNICDHCEGEFLLYLCSYINFFLSQGKTVLVLCPTKERAEQVSVAIDRAMNRLNDLCSVWNISRLEETVDHCRVNVLVCTADEFVEEKVAQRRKEFTADLFCTVLADGAELFSRDCIRTHRLFSELQGLEGMQQYILFTESNNDALRTAMELVTKKELIPFCHTNLRPGTGIMVWGEESAYRIQRKLGVGNDISPYMGTAIPLAILAAKYDMDKVHIVEANTRADRSYRDVLSMTRAEVMKFLQKSANLQSMIRTDNSEILDNSGEKVIVAYDTEYNFYQALWRWVKYGGAQKTLIHIVSPAYLLREYFVDKYHTDQLLLRNNDFDPLISYHQGMKTTRQAILLVSLCKRSMTERELMKKSREYEWEYENVVDLLEDCLKVVLTDGEIHSVYSVFQFRREKDFVRSADGFESETYVSLTDDDIRSRIVKKIKLAHMVSQNTLHTQLPILSGNIYNYYLRDQIVAINGYFYQIDRIGEGKVYAEQKNHSAAPEYLQLCDFIFRDYRQVDACVDTEFLDINICTANVTRKIYGYWETTCGNRIADGSGVMLHDLRGDGGGPEATYASAGVLEIGISRSILGDKAVEATRLFAYSLKELFRTLFPHSYQNLFVVIREEDGTSYAKSIFETTDHSLEEKAASLIPTVAPGFDTPRKDRITLYVVEASCLEYGMVQMLYERRQDVFRMLREYLQWYAASYSETSASEEETEAAHATGCASYLHFGGDRIPEVFSLEALLALCNRIVPTTAAAPVSVEEEVPPENMHRCSFCGATTMMPIEMNEGEVHRIMCRDCKDHQCTEQDEINSLYSSVFNSMQRDYGISMPTNLMVRFQTANAIYKFTGVGGSGGRVLGFYYHAGRQLWLEARGPEVALRSTIFHELTHAWQHHERAFEDALHSALRTFKPKYRKLARLLLVEGHAMYVEIDGMWEHHELVYANRLRKSTEERQDEYGIGYLYVREYLDEFRTEGSHMTPFVAMVRLLNDIADKQPAQQHLLGLVKLLLKE